jgi:hypothetical protein
LNEVERKREERHPGKDVFSELKKKLARRKKDFSSVILKQA